MLLQILINFIDYLNPTAEYPSEHPIEKELHKFQEALHQSDCLC